MSSIQILIVEDEAIVAKDIAYELRKLGYGIAGIAASGAGAIATALETQPDLVLMDICLRGSMDGVEAAQEIRDRLEIPILYLTANADPTTLERAKATQPFGYLLKPFEDRELQVAIEIALTRYQAEQEVKRTLTTIQQSQQGMATRNQRQSEYFSMASHEFRNPLALIRLTTDLLHNYGPQLSDDSRRSHLRRIQTALDSLDQLLQDVLTLGEADVQPRFQPAPINLVVFCEEQVEALALGCSPQHQLRFISHPRTLIAWVDEKLLWHILTNLLSNAIKFSPDGGEITLTLSCTTTEFSLQVHDQGVGIPPECRTCLFDPFHRAKNVTHLPGTGLGLAIAKRAVELHHGQISYSSQLGQGSTFTVSLPLTVPASGPQT